MEEIPQLDPPVFPKKISSIEFEKSEYLNKTIIIFADT
jgi:hypothetical protein